MGSVEGTTVIYGGALHVTVFGHLFHAILGCEFIGLRTENRLGLLDLLLGLDVLLELLLSLNTNALQVLSIGVEQIEILLKLWDFFVSQVESACSTGWSSETDLAFGLGNWGLR